MIIYFADRQLNIIGQASTELPDGLIVTADLKTEDVETGVAIFECRIPFDKTTRALVEECAEVGNYILRSHDNENELYTIIDAEIDTKKQEIYIYAEDDGMDLLNEVVGIYEAEEANPISHYINKYAAGAGFEIGINEAEGLTRKLSWDGESTAAERIASVATQFDGCEISYSFDVVGLMVTKKYINIYKKRGKDVGITLRLNQDIDRIVTTKSIANLATALQCVGGTPDQTTDVLEVSSDEGTPKILYAVSLETLSRTATTVDISASVEASLSDEESKFGKGYVLTASIYMGGSWHSGVIKEADSEWEGTTKHTTTFDFTVSGLTAAAITYTDIKFKVARSDSTGGNAGVLSEKSCSKHTVTNYVQDGENGEGMTERPMTIEGYAYDDGDFYVDGALLKSREALKNWSRYLWKNDDTQKHGGHIVKPFSYDTISQQELCTHAITELKKIRDMEINYEVDITKFPDNVKIGDRINIVDDAGELYVSARILQLETSVADQEYKATLGEYLIKVSGINQKVADLAAQFAKTSQSAARALELAKTARGAAESAQADVDAAVKSVEEAQKAVEEVADVVEEAKQSAANAQAAADSAQAIVDSVDEKVGGLETTVYNAQAAAENAYAAAETAQSKAEEAAGAAAKAQTDADTAKANASAAVTAADSASTKADTAYNLASIAKTEAKSAYDTANAAKADADQAEKDLEALGERLTTVSNTMESDYTRKTDFTETTASLQSQINQNAAQISLNVSSLTVIDETANNAAEQAARAQSTAEAAQNQADQATADAQAAQTAADAAANAASAAQSEADRANAAADAAKGVADKAEADLNAAKADLATVTSRVDATEEEITAAQQAVEAAQTAANNAKADADAAAKKATDAQTTANTAVANAANAQTAANDAASKANLAQQTADAAKGDAAAAQATANEAASTAAEAQRTADTAKTNAATAQTKANEAATAAAAAQQAANDADAKAAQAAADLATAEQNLANVTSRVDATEEEVAAAQAAVNTAQAAADKAKADAEAAQSTADTAKANAATAQKAANNAKTAADNAQAAADEAKKAADDAQDAVDALAVRVTTAETQITQNSEQIALRATKTEVTQTLGGYYTKSEADAAMTVKADEITSTVSASIETAQNTADNAIADVTSAQSAIQQLANSIATLIVDGNGASLMKQTENGWVFSIGEIENTISTATENIDSLSEDVNKNTSAVESVRQAVDDLGVLANYIRITVDGDQPCIELGESENEFKVRITNTEIHFADGTVIPTRITRQMMIIEKAMMRDGLQFGDDEETGISGVWILKRRSNGNLGLMWKEVNG